MKKFTFSFTQAAGFLVLIMVLRMFSLFMVIPVLSLHASTLIDWSLLEGVENINLWFGMAMGGYGLMQLLLQIPSGWLSDRLGRKPVIIAGLIFFIVGSVICEFSTNIVWLAFGRIIQGMGAVSAATTALLADLTSPEKRIRWMAMMGGGISFAFLVGFILGPRLYGIYQFNGFFLLPAYLAIFSIALFSFFPHTSSETDLSSSESTTKSNHKTAIKNEASGIFMLLRDAKLVRLNLGVFFLHATMIGIFVALPAILLQYHHLEPIQQWQFYGWIVPLSMLAAILFIWPTQRALRMQSTQSIRMSWVLPMMVLGLLVSVTVLSFGYRSYGIMLISMFIFFFAFNVLEALQPSLVSLIAPKQAKGSAMGAYHAFQSLGLFVGGILSAWLYRQYHAFTVFQFNAALIAFWLGLSLYSYFELGKKKHH